MHKATCSVCVDIMVQWESTWCEAYTLMTTVSVCDGYTVYIASRLTIWLRLS